MKELFVMLAKLITKEQCIERLYQDILAYKEAKLLGKDTENEERSVSFTCHLLLINDIEGDPKEIIEDMDRVNRSVNFFKTEKN